MLKEVLKQIEQRDRFLLTSHARPDGDAVGSALACCQILRSLGKEAEVVLREGVPRIYQMLPFADRVVQAERVNGNYEAAIILECESVQRTRLEGLENRFLISIDHHLSGRPFAARELDRSGGGGDGGDGLSPGRGGGSGDFSRSRHLSVHRFANRYRIVHVRRHERAYLLRWRASWCGPEPTRWQCARNIYFGHSTAKMRLLGAASVESAARGLTGHDLGDPGADGALRSAKEEDCEGLVNYALAIRDVEVAVFLRELPDGRYRVSLRSKGGLNVAAVAERFGGGGHECASGFSLEGPLEKAMERILGEIRA